MESGDCVCEAYVTTYKTRLRVQNLKTWSGLLARSPFGPMGWCTFTTSVSQ